MIPWIGPNESESDGGGILNRFGSDGNDGSEGNDGNDGSEGNDGRDGNDGSEGDGGDGNDGNDGNCFAIGTATGTGITIGPFFNAFKMLAVLAIFAIFRAFKNFNAPNLIANVNLALRNGAVIALFKATFAAIACNVCVIFLSTN